LQVARRVSKGFFVIERGVEVADANPECRNFI
jgi:hypothetical protein